MEQSSVSSLHSFASVIGSTNALQVSPDLIEKLPLAICACDSRGRMLWFNGRAASFWESTPRIGDYADTFFASLGLSFEAQPGSRAQRPIAAVLDAD